VAPPLPPTNRYLVQGAQIMSQYGINVPPGIPVFKLDELAPAAQKMADEAGEVRA
jgi:succinyl-CoA synthetase beta subunit